METADLLLLLTGVWLAASALALAVLVAVYAAESRERRSRPSGAAAEVKPLRTPRQG